MNSLINASTGLVGLDEVIDHLRLGDNVVWKLDSIEEYKQFVIPFVENALAEQKNVVYMRFADHDSLVVGYEGVKVYELDAHLGFETFSTKIHDIITHEGEETYYVFDCLSDLLSAWATDLMIGNFFMITCPYLYDLKTISYFSIFRNSHSYRTIARIRETTQLLLDVYRYEGNVYLHPLKVLNRYTSNMFLPHIWERNKFIPITNSVDTARMFAGIPKRGLSKSKRNLDYWDRLFMKASEILHRLKLLDKEAVSEQSMIVEQLCKLMIGRDDRILELANKYFSLEDLLTIKSRLIGSGYIGGKAVGMLLARNILLQDKSINWHQYLEPHDSFYIGSDVFYTFLVENGWWRNRMEQKKPEGYFTVAAKLKDKILNGIFPDQIEEQFKEMLEFFGQSPIIVRSSSLLEDNFGNAFAGKYDSVFCVNQGTPAQRYQQFINAVRTVYASTMNEDALTYRKKRGLDRNDEQMALLVQRVSGTYHKHYFFPALAGVGNSYNTYVWNNNLDPKAGMLRLVFGLGTRAVDRVEGDYPRIIAMDAPKLRPHAGLEDIRKYSQNKVDLLDTRTNNLSTAALNKLMGEKLGIKMGLFGILDHETNKRIKELNIKDQEAWIITFDKLISDTSFINLMKKMMSTLEDKYDYSVDIEFTVNFDKKNNLHINLVQCRPLQTKGLGKQVNLPQNTNQNNIILQSVGNFMGGSISRSINKIIFIDPQKYSKMNNSKKYELARIVGKLNKQIQDKESDSVMLLGPGRWGSSTPSLGVPVSFSEISNISILGEIAFESAGMIPELSFGTHFFQDLVETDIFYIAIFPEKEDVYFNKKWLDNKKNILNEILPDYGNYNDVLKVYNVNENEVEVISDIVSQKVICYIKS